MSKIYGSFFVLLILLLAPLSVSAEKKLPHYFPAGLEVTSTPTQQLEAYFRFLNITSNCQTVTQNTMPMFFENSMRVSRKLYGEDVTFIFDPWKKGLDGKITFFDFCGHSEVITEEQFNVVVEDFIQQFVQSTEEINYPFYKSIRDHAIEIHAKAVGMTVAELEDRLDDPVPEDPRHEVTYREINLLPTEITKASFVKGPKYGREVHFGYISALGEVWLNTGITYISLQGRIVDYMNGKPMIMAHEAVHGNSILQTFPLSEGWDPELGASIPAMLLPESKVFIVFHSYLEPIRELFWVFFGYNSEQIRNEIIIFDHDGNIRIDSKKLDEYVEKGEVAKKEMLGFLSQAMAEFYSNPIFWTSLGEKLQDKNAVMRIMMVLNYDPTILGGHEASMKWWDSHKDEVMPLAKEAYKESGDPKENANVKIFSSGLESKIRALAKVFGLTEGQMLEMARRHNLSEKDLIGKSEAEQEAMLRQLIQAELGKGVFNELEK